LQVANPIYTQNKRGRNSIYGIFLSNFSLYVLSIIVSIEILTPRTYLGSGFSQSDHISVASFVAVRRLTNLLMSAATKSIQPRCSGDRHYWQFNWITVRPPLCVFLPAHAVQNAKN